MTRELPEKLNVKQRKFVKEFGVLGIGPGDADFWEVWDSEGLAAGLPVSEQRETIIREAETVLLSLYRPNTVGEVECKNCMRKFMTNYRYNKHCSEDCLRQTLEAMGIKWDPDKPLEERWQGEPPGVIAPETLDVLKDWAKNIQNNWADEAPWKVHSSTFVQGNIPLMYVEVTETQIKKQTKSLLADLDLPDIDII